MKKILSLVLCVLLLCTGFSGCGAAESGKVVVCFDVSVSSDRREIDSFLRWLDFCNTYLELSISSEDVEVELIPVGVDPAERSTALQRLRAEIMAGRGPDVFVCFDFNSGLPEGEFPYNQPLFPFVEKMRESGVFLPLDQDLPNLTITRTDEMIPQVLESGKNQKGEQVILPMAFSVPGVIYADWLGEELPQCDFEGTSWNDVLQGDDPFLREQVNWALHYTNEIFYEDSYGYHILGSHSSGLFCLFPQVADYETEELCVSEEELSSIIKNSIAAYRRVIEQGEAYLGSSMYINADSLFGRGSLPTTNDMAEWDYSFAPLRNLESGSTAVVTQYCAVNANTDKKEKALAVIDALMCREFQKGGLLYQNFEEMPMYPDLLSPGTSYLDWRLEFTEEQYDMWRRICEDINIVRFPSPVDAELDAMMTDIEDKMTESLPPDVPRYPRDERLADCTISDEELERIVSEHYQTMQRLLDES